MKLNLIVLITNSLLFALQLPSYCQKTVNDSLDNDFNALILQSGYSSNTNSFGAFNQAVTQPGLSFSTSFFSKYNFDFSIYGDAIANSDDSLSNTTYELDLSAGYLVHLPWRLQVYVSYMHSFYSANSTIIKSDFSDQASVELSYNGKIWNPSVNGMYLMGKKEEFMLDANSTFNLEFDHFPFWNSTLLLMPGADVIFGRMQFYNDYLLQELTAHPRLFWYRYAVKKQLSRQEIINLLETDNRFTASSLGFNLPVSVSFKNWMFSASAFAIKPINQPYFMDSSWIFYFSVMGSYTFNW